MLKIKIITILCLAFNIIQAQTNQQHFQYIFATGSLQLPGADMAKSYGFSSGIGGGVGYKTKNNWVFETGGTFIFGNKINNDPLDSISNTNGQITNMYGDQAQIYLSLRGFYIAASAGKIITTSFGNKNSGILLKAGAGFMQHKIFIDNVGNNAPQVLGDYAKGYDRMCNGLAISQTIGWQNFSDNKGMHYFIGFEFTQGFTKNQRSWDFATRQKIDKQRLDMLYALKVAWFVPINKRQATKYYYY